MSKKYYKIKLNSLQNTFSKVDAGSNVYFEIQNSSESLDSIQLEEEDVVLATQSDEIFYSFSVSNQNDTRVQLHKSFEIEKSFDSNIDKEGVMLEIDEVEYNSICTSLFTDYNNGEVPLIARTHLDNLKEEFAAWLFQLGKYSRVYKKDRTILIEKLEEYENAYEIDFGIKIFDSQNISIETIIEELESNIIDDSGKIGDLNRKTVGNGSVKAILGTNNYIKFLKEKITKEKISSSNSPRVKGINKIYFGAPGTGKSFQITEDLKEVDNVFQERVTFHPEYDNASFVGGYKPITDKNGDIKYEFVPQIFTNTYVKACNDPDHQYYLIIEEINRGNCAEIFGELFQLLDRDPKYYITPSNELLTYLENNVSIQKAFKEGKMLLPDNLSILATMNTSDQSLFPMDSAFKRRWEWEYIPINYEKDVAKNRSAKFKIIMPDEKSINWIDFIEKVNQRIQNNRNLGMDKCIGNYFIKPDVKDEINIDQFIYKVLFYLWNDVFKDEPTDSIFKGSISYQDFFPIEENGAKLVNSIFVDLKIIEEPEV